MTANRFFKIQGSWAILVGFVLFLSCITVNVNFPESAVQRAADDFVRDLYNKDQAPTAGSTEPAAAEGPAKKKKKPAKPATEDKARETHSLHWIDDLFISSAYAQELNMHTPKADSIKERMKKRVDKISEWKKKGVLGETADGNLSLKEPKAAGDRLKELKTLVEDENEDRDELYEEIQSANSISDRKQTRIRKTFGESFQKNSPAGTWLESADGNWTQHK